MYSVMTTSTAVQTNRGRERLLVLVASPPCIAAGCSPVGGEWGVEKEGLRGGGCGRRRAGG